MKHHQANDPNEGASTRFELPNEGASTRFELPNEGASTRFELPDEVELDLIAGWVKDGRKSTAELDRERKREEAEAANAKPPQFEDVYAAITEYLAGGEGRPDEGVIRLLHQHAFFDQASGGWYRWSGKRWRRCDGALAEAAWAEGVGGKMPRRANVRGALERAREFYRLREVVEPDPLNPPGLVGFPDGRVLHGLVGVRDGRQSDYVTLSTAADPADSVGGSGYLEWAEVLESWIPDEESRLALQRTIGIALMGQSHRRFIVLVGGRASGKSSFLEAVGGAFGDYGEPVSSKLFTRGASEHETLIADLRGARFAYADEAPAGRSLNVARLKALTGGVRIKARFMRRDYFWFRPVALLALACNEAPFVKARDDALLERLRVIEFNEGPFDPDPKFAARLERMYPQILRWAIDGWTVARRTERDANDCPAWRKATDRYAADAPVTRVISLAIDDCRNEEVNRAEFVRHVHRCWEKEGETGKPPDPRQIWSQVRTIEPRVRDIKRRGTRLVWFPAR